MLPDWLSKAIAAPYRGGGASPGFVTFFHVPLKIHVVLRGPAAPSPPKRTACRSFGSQASVAAVAAGGARALLVDGKNPDGGTTAAEGCDPAEHRAAST